ncbi:MAG: glycosyltransferase family 4 protein [Gemmataceae bacterium]|nr:glycosyltransferase family 4 protein [Gemmataceae bacterium]
MRVLINQHVAFGARTGIGHYTRELLRALGRLAAHEQIDVFPVGLLGRASRMAATVSRPRGGLSLTAGRPGLLRRCQQQVLAAARPVERMVLGGLFRWTCRPDRYDVYHEPNFNCYPTDVATVATLHDLSVILHPEWHPAHRAAVFHRHFAATVRQARHFFAISEAARQEIIRVVGIAPDSITCTYMGVRAGLEPLPERDVVPALARLGLPPRYLLHVGTIEPRKNILRLMRAYCSLPAAYREAWPLVLVGGWGWNTDEVAEYYHREARHRGVRHYGYLAEEHLPAVYNGARALVFPSLYEGFGLPPVEMLACGGAVIASTAAAVAETVGTQAHLVDPEDEDGWRTAIGRILVDDDWRDMLRFGATEAARQFTWEQCAQKTLQVYRQVAAARARKQAA